ncbi:MAG: DUF2218 domain-containing protein [Geminicoccaceae bacterium]
MPDPTPSAVAEVATAHAARYLAQLCKHFAHKVPAEFADGRGRIAFPIGTCELTAGPERLTLSVAAADADQLARLQEVVARHLERFAFREPLAIAWR